MYLAQARRVVHQKPSALVATTLALSRTSVALSTKQINTVRSRSMHLLSSPTGASRLRSSSFSYGQPRPMLPSNTTRLQLQSPGSRRYFISSIARVAFSALRLPVTLFGVGAGTAGYVNYKLHEMSDAMKPPDWVGKAAEDAKGYWESIKDLEAPELGLSDKFKALFKKNDQQVASSAASGKNSEKNAENDDDPGATFDHSRRTRSDQDSSGSGSGGSGGAGGQEPTPSAVTAAMAAVAGTGVRIEDVADPGSAADNSLLQLTKRLIEIQNILNTVNVSNEALKLPRIVVIGSQSSGKSSVLEAIVGHSFLPKGTNMVTRRPIELTLVHTPGATEEYGEFPQLGLGKVHDFSKIQSTLTDLNKAVPESECVSSVPIDLRIYSPNVPDLKLVDLPGYIQVTSRNQPTLLRDKIRQLCEQYIVEPNIILAVCAADVDLANSEALQASRRVDPLGMRTIGVVTKMDLVDAHIGTSILTNKDYPLHLGYIGVARKVAPVGGSSRRLLSFGQAAHVDPIADGSSLTADAAAEAAFFSAHKEYQRSDINVGFGTLRNKLVSVLEENMGRNLDNITDAVQMELEEARYQSKVLYNDQLVTAESYAADAIDLLKRQFRDFASSFGKEQVRQALDATFEQRILDICAEQYWSDPRINEISPERWLSSILSHVSSTGSNAAGNNNNNNNNSTGLINSAEERNHYWTHRLERSTSALTKSGVGRWSTQMVADAIMANVSDITENYPLVHHPDTQKEVRQFAHELLRSKWHSTIDSVENTIKPLKYEIEVSQNEWKRGVDRATAMVQQELDQCQHALNNIKQRLGTSKLRRAVKYLIDVEKHKSLHPSLGPAALNASANSSSAHSQPPVEGATGTTASAATTAASSHHTETEDTTHHSPYSPAVLDQARRAVLLRDRAQILQLRLDALQSKTCRTEENKSACPEAFLRVVADKLASSAVIFINVELLSDFYFQFPREVDRRLYFGLGRDQVREFALNNPRIAQQLELIDRTQKLELVMGHLRQLQSAKSRQQQQKQQQQQQPKQQQDSHAPQMQAQYMRSH